MGGRRRRLYFPPLTVGFFVVVAVVLAVLITNAVHGYKPKEKDPTDQELYEAAVNDAMIIEEADIKSVVKLPDEKIASTNELGQVLMLTWHDTPYLYQSGSAVELTFGALWCVTDGELKNWYAENAADMEAAKLTARFEQLLGLPPKSGLTHFTGVWVWLEDLRRPAYTTLIESSEMQTAFAYEPEVRYKEWFDKTIIEKYFDGRYPWTRLGYTYDWSPEGKIYGLSEFIVLEGSSVTVESTRANTEFWEWLNTTLPEPDEK